MAINTDATMLGGGIVILRPVGYIEKLGMDDVQTLIDQIKRHRQHNQPRVLIDCTLIQSVCVEAVDVFAEAHRLNGQNQGGVALLDLENRLNDKVGFASLAKILPTFSDKAKAISSFQK